MASTMSVGLSQVTHALPEHPTVILPLGPRAEEVGSRFDIPWVLYWLLCAQDLEAPMTRLSNWTDSKTVGAQ